MTTAGTFGWLRRPALWCWCSALLIWAGFPGLHLWWVTPWVGLVPFIAAVDRLQPRAAAVAAWQAGCLCCGLTLLWLLGLIPIAGTLAALAFGLLVPLLAVFWAITATATGAALRRWRPGVILIFPAVWVCTEWLANHVFTGFGWVLLGYTQADNLPLAQLAAYGGVYAVSFVLALVNVLVWAACFGGGSGRVRIGAAAAAIAVIATAHGVGGARLTGPAPTSDPLRVGIVQGSFSTEVKWDSRYADLMWNQQVRQSRDAVQQGAELVVWSEAALGLHPMQRYEIPLRDLARQLDVPVVFGSNYFYTDRDGYVQQITNAAFAVHPDGRMDGPYDKRHLTPFGEYTPLKWLFPFLDNMIPAISDFHHGSANRALQLDGIAAQPLICFESVFPHEVRAALNDSKADLILHLTNVGWFGRTVMPEQDLALARFRAIESGVPMIRAANVGVSCIIDAHGRLLAVAESAHGRVFITDTVVGDVVPGRTPTPYARWGDTFVLVCAGVALLGGLLCYTRAPRPT